MISFESDYNNGAHPAVMRHLLETNEAQSQSYGFDQWSESARRKIRQACHAPEAQVYFLVGGTQANMTVIDGLLAHHEAVIATQTGHINVHEAGAVEFTGHRVITLPSHQGKMEAQDLERYLDTFSRDPSRDHVAQPGMVYITFPTEYGTLYTRDEIVGLRSLCQRHSLKLFIDGARLGYGLAATPDPELDLAFIAAHCDAFYIGGTKVGALCGEAVVFPHRQDEPRGFFPIVKQHGALLAKSRLAGVQFDALFTDDLYLSISRHAIEMARRLAQVFRDRGIAFSSEPSTNQLFVYLKPAHLKALEGRIAFELWERHAEGDDEYRFVTSWATREDHIQALAEALDRA